MSSSLVAQATSIELVKIWICGNWMPALCHLSIAKPRMGNIEKTHGKRMENWAILNLN
jgi:hypothetical protein